MRTRAERAELWREINRVAEDEIVNEPLYQSDEQIRVACVYGLAKFAEIPEEHVANMWEDVEDRQALVDAMTNMIAVFVLGLDQLRGGETA